MISPGEKLLIITRRLFETDLRRHFVGEVMEASGDMIRVIGHGFVFNNGSNEFLRIDELRTRLFSMVDGGLILVLLPPEVDLKKLHYVMTRAQKRFLTDGDKFRLNVTEFGAHR